MRTTVVLDDDLLEEAAEYSGITERSALIRAGLKALIVRHAAERLARLAGSQPDAAAPPRRRFPPEE